MRNSSTTDKLAGARACSANGRTPTYTGSVSIGSVKDMYFIPFGLGFCTAD